MCSGVPYEPWGALLAPGPSGVVDAAEAAAGLRVTELGRALRVCVTAAVAWHTGPRCVVEARAAEVTVWAAVVGKALVTHGRAAGIAVTGAIGGGVGAGTRSTGFSQGGTRTAVETGLTLLTLGALGVPLTVQAASRLWVAVVGVVVALAGPAAGVAEVVETWVALVTLGPIHSCLTRARP